jgi:catechol 2,3-dioxygenase-like lactoylglutathione lyase family enzyme
MFDHVGIKVTDLKRSAAFYAAALEPLGCVQGYADDAMVGIGPKDAPTLWLYRSDTAPGVGTHVALRAKSRQSVDRFHEAALRAGGLDNGAPGVRPDYGKTYYAAFIIDPDGHNIEAVMT